MSYRGTNQRGIRHTWAGLSVNMFRDFPMRVRGNQKGVSRAVHTNLD